MINRLVSAVKSQNTTQEISTLIKDVWQEIKNSKSNKNNIDFLKEIICGKQSVEIQPNSLRWRVNGFDIVFFDDVDGQVLESKDAFNVPLTDSNLDVFLRLELYYSLLSEYDVCTQDKAKAIWELIQKETY